MAEYVCVCVCPLHSVQSVNVLDTPPSLSSKQGYLTAIVIFGIMDANKLAIVFTGTL